VFVGKQSGSVYWSSVRDVLNFENVFSGIAKPFIFGILIAGIGCYTGLATRGGSAGLRQATTQAVVFSIIVVIVMDFVLTRILLSVLGFSI
jgi:phospholipid/cholesterol/gamma-HCH transport system permease protein